MLVTLTWSQVMALRSLVAEHLRCPHPTEVYVDCSTDPSVETTPSELLTALMTQIQAAPPSHQGLAHESDTAIDTDGNILPYTPDKVRRIVDRGLVDGEILGAILRLPSGDLAVQVLGGPSKELLDALEQATTAYRRALKGARKGH